MEDFQIWVAQESAYIETELRLAAARGACDGLAVYFTPAKAHKWARLTVARSCPIGATQTLFFRFADIGITSNIAAIPYQDIAAHIRAACRDLPVYPVAPATYRIRNAGGDYWNNLDGWTACENMADCFSLNELNRLSLPVGGHWEAIAGTPAR